MEIAKSLYGISEDWRVQGSLDRSTDIGPIVASTLEGWQVDLYKLNPTPSYNEDGEFTGTSLSMYHLLRELEKRQPVMIVRAFSGNRGEKERSDQEVVSQDNRRGPYAGLMSNSTHGFNIKLRQDYNVIQELEGERHKVGAPRYLTIIKDFGEPHEGFKGLEYTATTKENDWFREKGIILEPDMDNFQHFVPPQMAFSFMGSKYVTAKIVEERVTEESKYHRALAQQLRDAGISLGDSRGIEYETTYKGPTKPVKGKVLEAIIEHPSIEGDYRLKGRTREGEIVEYRSMPDEEEDLKSILRHSSREATKLAEDQRRLRTHYRAVELAMRDYGFKDQENYEREIQPSWNVPEWQRDYKQEGKRKRWNKMSFNKDIGLLYRVVEKTVRQKE